MDTAGEIVELDDIGAGTVIPVPAKAVVVLRGPRVTDSAPTLMTAVPAPRPAAKRQPAAETPPAKPAARRSRAKGAGKGSTSPAATAHRPATRPQRSHRRTAPSAHRRTRSTTRPTTSSPTAQHCDRRPRDGHTGRDTPDIARAPRSTYRLQITADFPLPAAIDQLDYLADLGVDWVYLSPLLQAEPGSTHGYDVTDHSRVDADRGGAAGLTAFCAAAHERGLGVLVDIVPNHLGVASPALSAWWWDVLAGGPQSRYASAFDIDWAAGDGKLLLPILGSPDDVDRLRSRRGRAGLCRAPLPDRGGHRRRRRRGRCTTGSTTGSCTGGAATAS